MEEQTNERSQSLQASTSMRLRLYRWKKLLRRCWWVLLLTVSLGLCLQAFLIYREPPTFVSVGSLWVSGKIALPEGGMYREELQNFFGTQIKLLNSDLLQRRTHQRLRLVKPNLAPSFVSLRVSQVPRAAVFDVRAIGTNQAYTEAFLQAHMEEYLNYKRELRAQSSDEALSSITEQLLKPQRELKEEQEKLLKFQQENNLVFLEQQGSSAGSYLAKLSTRLADLKTEYQLMQLLTTDQSAERGARGLSLGPEARLGVESSAQFAGFIKAREQIQVLKAERADLSQYLQDKHPKMVKLAEEIARMENLLEIYKQQNQESLVSTRQSLELQIRNLEESIKEWEGKAAESSRKMAEHQRLQMNVKRQQELYDRLLNLIQSVGVNKNLDQENVSIMENASTAFPVRSNVLNRLILAALGGLIAGLGILYFIDRHDDRVSSVTELMGLFEFPVVGHVPAMPEVKGRPNLELIHAHDPRHSYVECFRDIRSALLFASSDAARPRTIIVTSAIPNEGKSTVSANLAVTLALAGARVLLIDADLRCGTLHQLFGLASEPGFSELLLKQAHLQDCVKATGTPNLYVMPCGHALVNPGELFLQPGTEALLRELREQFDYVILDSAPVLATADTCSLAPKVDGVLVIIRGAFTSARLTRQSLDFLVQRQIKVLGLILNRVDTSFPEYYQYKYGKYYHSNTAKRV